MRPTQAILRPLTERILTGSGVRYARNINAGGIQKRSILSLKDHVYFSKATAEGPGRHGFVKSFGDAPLDLKMDMPKTAGGKGDGQNPEQLFAMGYASCFLGALQLAAARANKKDLAENAKVTANVFLGHPLEPDIDGFGLRAEIMVEGCPDDAIIAEAHEFCPYSRALEHGAEVTITKA
ncbi:OsmC-domain-containing protein [Dichomitus squalens]|uniref:OsmC-domain-containing protein n=1 Tax=Dichomitus squalens TaxID=114155 RepID=A0A4Q9N9F4_9APHY|nr:OsmC-domain-containing protein [Dichomitus squalens]TBU37450.1 OsmC-domain-containing protein [Dichomitus squalens]TBU51553.1 OsmC-domain-containing protein [Dichomitus squalens]